MSDIVKFKGASLPSKGLGNYQHALLRAKDQVGVVSNTPFLKLQAKTGDWVYGPNDEYVEENSLWAIDPTSFECGFIAWRGGRPVGKKMRNIAETPVTTDELSDVGAEWDVCVGFKLLCIHGEDAGGPGKEAVTVEYTSNSYGGKKAYSNMLSAMYRQSEEDPSKPVPVVEILTSSYPHAEYGKIYNPEFKIRKWMAMEGEPPAQSETQPDDKKPDTEQTAPTNGAASSRRRAAPVVTDVETETVEAAKPAQGPVEPVQRRRRRAATS